MIILVRQLFGTKFSQERLNCCECSAGNLALELVPEFALAKGKLCSPIAISADGAQYSLG